MLSRISLTKILRRHLLLSLLIVVLALGALLYFLSPFSLRSQVLPPDTAFLRGVIDSEPLAAGLHSLTFRGQDSYGQVLETTTVFTLVDSTVSSSSSSSSSSVQTSSSSSSSSSTPTPQACTDSDGGNNPNVAGAVTYLYNGIGALAGTQQTKQDICISGGTTLIEFYCSAANNLELRQYPCTCTLITLPDGTSAARCVSQNSSSSSSAQTSSSSSSSSSTSSVVDIPYDVNYDVNGDGCVSETDTQLVIDIIENTIPDNGRADISGDDFVSGRDLLLIINYLLRNPDAPNLCE